MSLFLHSEVALQTSIPLLLRHLPPLPRSLPQQNGGLLLQRGPPAQSEEQLLAVVAAARHAAAEEARRVVQHVAVELMAAAEVSADLEEGGCEW